MKNLILIKYLFVIAVTTVLIFAKVSMPLADKNLTQSRSDTHLDNSHQIITVDTISDLTTINTANVKTVFVKGYNMPNDGGGGFFSYDLSKSTINNVIKDDSSNIVVSGNEINRCGLYGIFIYKLRSNKGNILISDNIIDDTYGGLAISAKGMDGVLDTISVNANIFSGIKTHGISIEGNTSVNIIANTLRNVSKNAIYMRGNRDAVVNANSIIKSKIAFRMDATTYSIDNLVISNNVVVDVKSFMSKTSLGGKVIFVNNLDNMKIRSKGK